MKSIIFFLLFIVLVSDIHASDSTGNKDAYDFTTEKILNNLGEYQIAVNDSNIIFDSVYGKLDAPLHYSRQLNTFNFDGLYKITDHNNRSYYFRFGWMEYKNSRTIFSNVNWINGNRPASGKYDILTIYLKLEQHGHISLCTIGDSQTWWNAANNLRKCLNDDFPDLYFVGSRTDINGYPHEGEGGNHTNQVLARINFIPKADYYTLLIGTNDWQGNIDTSFDNINTICHILLKKYPKSKILYLTPLPTTNMPRDQFNRRLQGMLMNRFKSNRRIEVVDTGGKMRKSPQWSVEYLRKDGLHESPDGILLMAELIANKVKSEN